MSFQFEIKADNEFSALSLEGAVGEGGEGGGDGGVGQRERGRKEKLGEGHRGVPGTAVFWLSSLGNL